MQVPRGMTMRSSGSISGASSCTTGEASIGVPSGAMDRGIAAGLSAGCETALFSGRVAGFGASC